MERGKFWGHYWLPLLLFFFGLAASIDYRELRKHLVETSNMIYLFFLMNFGTMLGGERIDEVFCANMGRATRA